MSDHLLRQVIKEIAAQRPEMLKTLGGNALAEIFGRLSGYSIKFVKEDGTKVATINIDDFDKFAIEKNKEKVVTGTPFNADKNGSTVNVVVSRISKCSWALLDASGYFLLTTAIGAEEDVSEVSIEVGTKVPGFILDNLLDQAGLKLL